MLCLYPTASHMQSAVFELTGRHQALPFFTEVRVDHPWVIDSVLALHKALAQETSPLECESRFTWTLAQLIKRYADIRFDEQQLGQERKAVQQARPFLFQPSHPVLATSPALLWLYFTGTKKR